MACTKAKKTATAALVVSVRSASRADTGEPRTCAISTRVLNCDSSAAVNADPILKHFGIGHAAVRYGTRTRP